MAVGNEGVALDKRECTGKGRDTISQRRSPVVMNEIARDSGGLWASSSRVPVVTAGVLLRVVPIRINTRRAPLGDFVVIDDRVTLTVGNKDASTFRTIRVPAGSAQTQACDAHIVACDFQHSLIPGFVKDTIEKSGIDRLNPQFRSRPQPMPITANR